MHDAFRKMAHWTSDRVGSPWAFAVAIAIVLAWAVAGPFFGYSDTWQLVINTGTTVLTFLMVFIIQNTQNRDGRAIHLKLDELIRSLRSARDSMIDVEDIGDEEMATLKEEFKAFRDKKFAEIRARRHAGKPHAHPHPHNPYL